MSKDQIRLMIQPESGVTPLIQALDGARESVDLLIFRFDRREMEHALVRAVERGVRVRALIAHTSSGGEKMLRALEMRFLKAGITVSRTAEDLARYHGKMMLVDQKELYLLGFNFTYLDIDRSRSFGVIVKDPKLVEEAAKLFEADCTRTEYQPADDRFLVSPINARESLARFLQGATKELLVYDPNLNDKSMLSILDERAQQGVAVRTIGCSTGVVARRLRGLRLHVRLIVRDDLTVFLGSQSLRPSELDRRREIGVILEDAELACAVKEIFERDWKASEPAPGTADIPLTASKIAKRIAKAVTNELPPLSPTLEIAVKEVAGAEVNLQIRSEELEETVRTAVKQAVKEAVREAVEQVEPV
jgi:phosphatidylserine/phosphatidylglycerophosphate/cardiolipin synthase-like enzyme